MMLTGGSVECLQQLAHRCTVRAFWILSNNKRLEFGERRGEAVCVSNQRLRQYRSDLREVVMQPRLSASLRALEFVGDAIEPSRPRIKREKVGIEQRVGPRHQVVVDSVV